MQCSGGDIAAVNDDLCADLGPLLVKAGRTSLGSYFGSLMPLQVRRDRMARSADLVSAAASVFDGHFVAACPTYRSIACQLFLDAAATQEIRGRMI